MAKLSKEALRFLEWIRDKPCNSSGWIGGSRRVAAGKPETWTHFQVQGREGQITVTREVMEESQGLFEGNPDCSRSMWRITDAGRACLEGQKDG